MDESGGSDWIELDNQLAKAPRQMDLMGDPLQEVLVQNARVPPGYFREVRLQFLEGAASSGESSLSDNACGKTGWNCVVRADGRIERLRWTGAVPELLIPLQSIHSNSLVVLPDLRTDLQLKLEPRQELLFSGIKGWNAQTVLTGSATVQQPWTAEDGSPTAE
jgi:hypothetical protein